MARPTIFILALVAAGISMISCRYIRGHHHAPGGTITEMTYHGKVTVKKFTCPAIYGRYAHPESCGYFYECRFGWPTLMHCNKGYLYDEEREQCRDKKKVKCRIGTGGRDGHEHKEGKDNDLDVSVDVGHFKCPYPWGTFAHPQDCSKYYVCLHSYPKLFQCRQNFLYDVRIRRCLPSYKVKCGNRLDRDQLKTKKPVTTTTVRPETTTEITTETPFKFFCPFPYGRYPDPEDCSRYFECRFSIPELFVCPQSTLYDERKEQCIDAKQVNCGGRPGGLDNVLEPEDDQTFHCPYIWGTFSHPVDCSKYIVCIYNVPTIFSCRKNQLFDARARRCLPRDQVSCDDRVDPDDPFGRRRTTTSVPTTTTTTPIPTTTTTPPTTTTTPTTTTPTPVPTTTTTTPTPTTTTTTPAPTTTTTTPAPTTTSSTPVPTTTSVLTTGSRVTKPNTPPPTDCEEDDLDCIIDGTGDIAGWFDCPQRFGHFPHGSSRQLFIHCDNWHPFVKKCADETLFSPEFHVCVWGDKSKGKYNKAA